MSYSEFIDFLHSNGVSRTDAKESELALTKADALKALDLLDSTDVGILGGDVYNLESDGYFRPIYDNWYCNKADFSPLDFAEKSRDKAFSYLRNYKEADNAEIRYVLVTDRVKNKI